MDSSKSNKVFEIVREFQRRVLGATFPRDKDALTEKYCLLISKEAFELLDHTSYKPHKPKKEDMDVDAIRDEIADVYIYTLACAGMWFEDHEDLLDKALEKMGVNKKRLDGVVEENNGDRNR